MPVNEYGLIYPDQPVLCGPGSTKPYAERVRFVGDQIAIVVAETEEIAENAKQLIKVEFEDLPLVTDAEKAMEDDALILHPDKDSNIFCHYRVRKGDMEAGFGDADIIIEGVYRTPVQEHAYLQPEAGISYIDEEGRITVVVAGQWTHEDQEQVAHALNVPHEKIRIIYPAIGGAFGGREDMSIQIVLALATMKLQEKGVTRPVKTIWSREESIIGHHKRHIYTIRSKWGAKNDGRLTAAQVKLVEDGGAYAYTSTKVLGNATLMCTGPYDIPNVKVDAFAVYTNLIPGGAFRGFGGPQGAFSAEMQMDKLAEALEMDPVELRMKNLFQEGSILSMGTPLPAGVSIPDVTREAAKKAGWVHEGSHWNRPRINQPESNKFRRGIGFAAGFKNVGFSFGAPENAWATVEIHGEAEIEKVVLRHAGAEVGQGAHTVMAQMTAEAVGIPVEKVELIVSDTASTDDSGSASASRMTFMSGNSIRGAAELALKRWRGEERPAIGTYQYRPPATTPMDPQTGKSEPNFAYGYVAQAVTVDVDIETGHVYLVDVISANDVGKAINPQQVQGQIEGAVIQAAGYALMEDFKYSDGRVDTAHLSTYLIPGILDIPEQVQGLILEFPDPIGPWGARGMAEMPYMPLTPAIASAIHDAIGIWFDEFPFTPQRILSGMLTASQSQ